MNIEDLQSQEVSDSFVSRFAGFAEHVRRDPYRANLLPHEIVVRLVKLPWAAPKNFFIAMDGEQPIATLSATISSTTPDQGFIGFYECDLGHPQAGEASQALIGKAEAFLKCNGASSIQAPVNYNTWFPYRFLKPGTEPPFYSWEPVQPPEYAAHFQKAGYTEGTHYVALTHLDYTPLLDQLSHTVDEAMAQGYRFRPFDVPHLLEREVPILYGITMRSYRNNYLFEPISLETFRDLYFPIARKLDFSLCFFLVDPAGQEVGYLFSFMDEKHPDHYIWKTTGLIPELRGGGLGNAMMCHGLMLARNRGATRAVQALVHSPARRRSYDRWAPPSLEHQYVLMAKKVA